MLPTRATLCGIPTAPAAAATTPASRDNRSQVPVGAQRPSTRIGADGNAGYSIPVFGGLHGDVPLASTAGPIIADFVKKARAAGLKTYVWTVDSVRKAKELITAGVDGITTFKPGTCANHASGFCE